jgi:hypothetical protein
MKIILTQNTTVGNKRLGAMAGYLVKSGAVLRGSTRGDLKIRGSKSATVPSVETLYTIFRRRPG